MQHSLPQDYRWLVAALGAAWMALGGGALAFPAEGARDTSGGEVRRFEGHTGPVRRVAFSADGRRALSGSGFPGGDQTMRLWDVHTGKELRRFLGHTSLVVGVAFTPDGKRALSASS